MDRFSVLIYTESSRLRFAVSGVNYVWYEKTAHLTGVQKSLTCRTDWTQQAQVMVEAEKVRVPPVRTDHCIANDHLRGIPIREIGALTSSVAECFSWGSTIICQP
jgi:hypothetical protein